MAATYAAWEPAPLRDATARTVPCFPYPTVRVGVMGVPTGVLGLDAYAPASTVLSGRGSRHVLPTEDPAWQRLMASTWRQCEEVSRAVHGPGSAPPPPPPPWMAVDALCAAAALDTVAGRARFVRSLRAVHAACAGECDRAVDAYRADRAAADAATAIDWIAGDRASAHMHWNHGPHPFSAYVPLGFLLRCLLPGAPDDDDGDWHTDARGGALVWMNTTTGRLHSLAAATIEPGRLRSAFERAVDAFVDPRADRAETVALWSMYAKREPSDSVMRAHRAVSNLVRLFIRDAVATHVCGGPAAHTRSLRVGEDAVAAVVRALAVYRAFHAALRQTFLQCTDGASGAIRGAYLHAALARGRLHVPVLGPLLPAVVVAKPPRMRPVAARASAKSPSRAPRPDTAPVSRPAVARVSSTPPLPPPPPLRPAVSASESKATAAVAPERKVSVVARRLLPLDPSAPSEVPRKLVIVPAQPPSPPPPAAAETPPDAAELPPLAPVADSALAAALASRIYPAPGQRPPSTLSAKPPRIVPPLTRAPSAASSVAPVATGAPAPSLVEPPPSPSERDVHDDDDDEDERGDPTASDLADVAHDVAVTFEQLVGKKGKTDEAVVMELQQITKKVWTYIFNHVLEHPSGGELHAENWGSVSDLVCPDDAELLEFLPGRITKDIGATHGRDLLPGGTEDYVKDLICKAVNVIRWMAAFGGGLDNVILPERDEKYDPTLHEIYRNEAPEGRTLVWGVYRPGFRVADEDAVDVSKAMVFLRDPTERVRTQAVPDDNVRRSLVLGHLSDEEEIAEFSRMRDEGRRARAAAAAAAASAQPKSG